MSNNAKHWDAVYSKDEALWQGDADPVLAQYLGLVSNGKAIDFGCGQGRTSFYLAKSGFAVEAVDISTIAIENCIQRAGEQGLDIGFHCQDIQEYTITPDTYSLIVANWVLSYFTTEALQDFLGSVVNGLKQSGIIYCNFFSRHDPGFHASEQNDTTTYYRFEEVLRLFPEFRIIHAADVIGMDLSHGQPHYHGIIQFMGQKV